MLAEGDIKAELTHRLREGKKIMGRTNTNAKVEMLETIVGEEG